MNIRHYRGGVRVYLQGQPLTEALHQDRLNIELDRPDGTITSIWCG